MDHTPGRTSGRIRQGTADLSADTDYDLLEMMTWTRTDPEGAKQAWAAFYNRHVEYMYDVCSKFTSRLGGDAAAQDLVQETFIRVFKSGAATFKPGQSRDAEAMRSHVRGWLGQIAENLAKDALRGRRTDGCSLTPEHWQDVAEATNLPAPTPEVERLRQVMDSVLDERERYVLLTKFQWYEPGKDNQKLPNEVAADLAAQLGTTAENYRQIASRALRKLKAALLGGTDGSSFNGQDAI